MPKLNISLNLTVYMKHLTIAMITSILVAVIFVSGCAERSSEKTDTDGAGDIAENHVNLFHFLSNTNLKVVDVIRTGGSGNYKVYLKSDETNFKIIIQNWKIKKEERGNVLGEKECKNDLDCVPFPLECPTLSCINKKYESEYKSRCTIKTAILNGANRPEDCICSNGICTNKNKDLWKTIS